MTKMEEALIIDYTEMLIHYSENLNSMIGLFGRIERISFKKFDKGSYLANCREHLREIIAYKLAESYSNYFKKYDLETEMEDEALLYSCAYLNRKKINVDHSEDEEDKLLDSIYVIKCINEFEENPLKIKEMINNDRT